MKNYHIWTIGCQMNVADSERLESALGQMGLEATDQANEADVVVLNSCVVRQSAEDKVVGMLSNLKSFKQRYPDRILALMGCLVGPKSDHLRARFPHVDVFMRPQDYEPLISLLGDRMGVDPEGCIGPLIARPDVTAYIPIIHGCDKFCSFCIIPYRRGREVSRPIAEVVREAELLAQRGVREVTLLGQNVDSYGHDLPGRQDLGDLLAAVSSVDELDRVRFLTSHPNDMSNHIIEAIAELAKVCEHINLPFQAGDNEVLARMRRGYTNEEYRTLINRIRDRIPKVSLSTDIIVGFPGETKEQFERTVELVTEVRFDKVHAAAYSTRPGTIAARSMDDDIQHKEKQARLRIIEDLQKEILTDINAPLRHLNVEILVEGRRRGSWYGRSRNDKLVYFDDEFDRTGQLVDIRIDNTGPWALHGAIAS